jgi:hypothetical protein
MPVPVTICPSGIVPPPYVAGFVINASMLRSPLTLSTGNARSAASASGPVPVMPMLFANASPASSAPATVAAPTP